MSSKTPIFGTILNINELVSMDVLNLYAHDLKTPCDKTHHEYSDQFPFIIKNGYDAIKNGGVLRTLQHYYSGEVIDNIEGMNELYITCIGADGSDQVFETEHLDGPLFFLPFCTVMRCVLAISGNSSIITEFPCADKSVVLKTGEFVAFDYNRDVHYIWKDHKIADSSKRVLLKLHYLITPVFLPRPVARFYGSLHDRYNKFMRSLFLSSQKKNAASTVVNYGTTLYCFLYRHADVVGLVASTLLIYFISK
jgi:hypothetical protein